MRLPVVVALATIAFADHAQVPTKPDLLGHVISAPAKSVKATIVLCYWQRKPGKQPSDMRDLPRQVQTDDQVNFRFESLDPSLLYQVHLIFAPGCRQQTFKRVDPTSGPRQLRPELMTNG
jgi:hypothetical protein